MIYVNAQRISGESPLWPLITFALQLQFWNLKQQSLWFSIDKCARPLSNHLQQPKSYAYMNPMSMASYEMLVARMCKVINEPSSKVRGMKSPNLPLSKETLSVVVTLHSTTKSKMFVGSGTWEAQVMTPECLVMVWYHHHRCIKVYVELIIVFIFLSGHLLLVGVKLGEEQRTNTIKRDWMMSSNFINHFTLHNEHIWEDMLYSIEESTNTRFQWP